MAKAKETETAVAAPANTSVAQYDADVIKNLLKSDGFLGRFQLMTSSSNKCKAGEFQVNHYALVSGDDFRDLGTDVDILVLKTRMKALDMSGDEVISVFDPKINADGEMTGVFAEIKDKSEIKDSSCMWGPEFLIWIPAVEEFATFFMGSKTSRGDAGAVLARLGKAATMRSKKIEGKKHTWFSPAITPCSTPFDPPPVNRAVKEVDKFLNPPELHLEVADAPVKEQAR